MGCFLVTNYNFKLTWHIRQHCHLPRTLNGRGNFTLVVAAQARFFARFYFIKARNKTRQQFNVFVIHVVDIFSTKVTEHANVMSTPPSKLILWGKMH